MTSKKSALGKGLSSLLQDPSTDITSKDFSGKYALGAIPNIPLNQIETNPFQPRTNFDDSAINELCESIKSQGVITPITVRKLGYDKYQLISGERRYRASKMAGLNDIPAYIRVANDEQMLEMALVENIQRKDLNPIEVAISFNRLIEECDLTQEALSSKVGKNRSTISNYLRLLKLPAEIQKALKEDVISMAHARTIISVDDPEKQKFVFNKIIENKLSVRDVEGIVKSLNKKPLSKKDNDTILPVKYELFKNSLKSKLGSDISMKYSNKGTGSITINFKSQTQLDTIISKLGN